MVITLINSDVETMEACIVAFHNIWQVPRSLLIPTLEVQYIVGKKQGSAS